MGVYVKGMEMPKSCSECFVKSCKGRAKNKRLMVQRGEDCPLVPVPPHGDLIERDALRASIRESIEECHKWADEVDKDTMMYARISQSLGTFVECSLRAKAAPTIIPAEGET